MNEHFYDALMPFLTDEEQQGLTVQVKQFSDLNAQLSAKLEKIKALKADYLKVASAERDDIENLSDDERAAELKKCEDAQAQIATLQALIAETISDTQNIIEFKKSNGGGVNDLIHDLLIRYLKARKGDTQAILNDLAHALDGITLEDYKSYVRRSKKQYKALKEEYKALVDAGGTLTPDQQRRLDAASRRATARWNNCVLYLKACTWDFYETLIYSSTGRVMYSANGVNYLGENEITENSEVGNLVVDGIEEADELIRARADAFGYKRPTGKAAKLPAIINPLSPMPSSAPINVIFTAMGFRGHEMELPDRMGETTKAVKWTMQKDKAMQTIVDAKTGKEVEKEVDVFKAGVKSKTTEITLQLPVGDAIAKQGDSLSKFFVLFMQYANDHAYHDGALTTDVIAIPFDDILSKGMYTSDFSIRKGFEPAREYLTSVKIQGQSKITNKKTLRQDTLQVLFTGGTIENRVCYMQLNPHLNWKFMMQYFSILPDYYYRLSSRGANLLWYLFYRGRQVADEKHTSDDGKIEFNISYKTIQHRLGLPSEIGNRKRKETIYDPIESAIYEIEEAHLKDFNNDELQLEVYDAGGLDSGYVKVILSGQFAKSIIEIGKNKAKAIKKTKAQVERVQEQALIINTAKKMEREQAAATDHPDTKTDNAAGMLEGSKPHEEHEQTGTTGAGNSTEKPGVRPDGT